MLCKSIKLRKLIKPIINSISGVKLICFSRAFLIQSINPNANNSNNTNKRKPINGFKPITKFCCNQITDNGKRVNNTERMKRIIIFFTRMYLTIVMLAIPGRS